MTALLLVLDAQLADAMTFLLAVSRVGIGGESNPAMAARQGPAGDTLGPRSVPDSGPGRCSR